MPGLISRRVLILSSLAVSLTVNSNSQTLRQSIKQHTVDRLKHILTGLNEECGTSLYKSGKKQELIDRIIAQLDSYRQSGNVANWTKAKAVLYLVRNTGT
jgi:E3 SUMO-protein ligase PIAS1